MRSSVAGHGQPACRDPRPPSSVLGEASLRHRALHGLFHSTLRASLESGVCSWRHVEGAHVLTPRALPHVPPSEQHAWGSDRWGQTGREKMAGPYLLQNSTLGRIFLFLRFSPQTGLLGRLISRGWGSHVPDGVPGSRCCPGRGVQSPAWREASRERGPGG